MNKPLCKHCDKPMMIDHMDRYDTWYKCNCEGYQKEQRLIGEIRDIENALMRKKMELSEHMTQSSYNRGLGKLKRQLSDFENMYRE